MRPRALPTPYRSQSGRAFASSHETLITGRFAGDEQRREIVATRIIDLARNGVIDAKALRYRVLLESQSAAQVNQVALLRA
jgi:hypothetical protein